MKTKTVLLVGGAAAAYVLYDSGLLEAFLNPPDDDDYDDDVTDDPGADLNINNPLALLAISMATRAGLKGAAKAASKVVKARNPPAPSKIPPKVAGAGSVKPSAAKPVVKPPVKPPAAAAAAVNSGTKLASTTTAAVTQTTSQSAKAAAVTSQKSAQSAAKAAKGSNLIGKLKGTPADLIVMIIAQILTAVLDLDPSSFKNCHTGEFDLGALPDWAQAMIGAVPFLGDLFDLLGNKLCLRAGCAAGSEESGGLCYTPCEPGFKSDGAIMCYKQYPDFENNGMGHTITSITKKILLDTGQVPSACNDDEDKVGLLCYEKAPPDWTNVAGTIWQNCPAGFTDTGVRCEKNWDVGAGRLPRLSDCPSGWTNDGLTCRAPITMSSCNAGDVDDGLLCRVPIRCDPVTWDGCCSRGLFNECYGCARGGGCHGGNVYHKTLYGGQVEGRTLKGPEANEERVDGLDYNKCPDGYGRIPGMPFLCTQSFTKQSRVLGPRPAKCPKRAPPAGITVTPGQEERDTDIAGLCYSSIPKGYSRKLLGTLDQDCPAGSTDFGVGCTRQAYSRGAGLIPLGIRVKDRL